MNAADFLAVMVNINRDLRRNRSSIFAPIERRRSRALGLPASAARWPSWHTSDASTCDGRPVLRV